MHRVLGLKLLVVVLASSARALQEVPVLPETPILTEADFDLDKFMGKWYEKAVVSTCLQYLQRKGGNPVMSVIQMKDITANNFTMITRTLRNELCKEITTVLNMTNTPGQFFHQLALYDADVDSFVVHTNYDEYAMMILISTNQISRNKSLIGKLYSRTVDVRPAVLENFKSLVQEHGMSPDVIIMNQYRGECVSDQQVTEATAQPQRT